VNTSAGQVQRVYLLLTLLTTLAASFIWGVNTLFLLDAGLNNTEAFAANAFFSIGMVIFEVPTGVVADTRGRRFSFMLGAATQLVATRLYRAMWQKQAPFIGWALASIMLGLGFTFFSGATEAWLVDALGATGFKGNLETVFGRGQTIAGVAMLVGSVAGGVVAQMTSLGVPYVLRAILLGVAMLAAFVFMRDLGFTPKTGVSTRTAVKDIARGSIDGGLRNRPVRWMMLAAPFTGGVGFYAFYAMQPYLLELYGQTGAYGIAGLAAAIVAGAQIIGGLSVPIARRYFSLRTNVVLLAVALESVLLVAIAIVGFNYSGTGLGAFFMVLGLLVAWALVSAIAGPIRQAFLNGLIASEQRATVLSFDSLMGSIGGTVVQPAMGRVADVSGYAASYLVSGAISALAVPFIFLARREKAPSDPIDQSETIAA
jgi:MFS family permease